MKALDLARTAADVAGEPVPEPSTPEPDAALSDLASRGHFLLACQGRLFVTDASTLTPTDRATIATHKAAYLDVAIPWAHREDLHLPRVQFATLADVINARESEWRAQEPPSLDGIHDIILNWETNGLHWHKGDVPIGVTIGSLDGKLKRFLPWGFRGGNLDKDSVIRYLQREVRNKHITNANMKFEVHMGQAIGVDLEAQGNTVSDVQHMAALIDDNRRKFALDILAKEFLDGVQVPRVDESRMATYHASEVAERAEYQVTLVSQLREKFWPILDKEDLQRVRQLEDEVIYPTVEMERNAAPIDVPLLHQWCDETEALCSTLHEQIAKEVGGPFSPDSSADWQHLFEHFGLENKERTASSERYPNGQPSFTDKVLKQVDHPFVKMGRKLGKLLSLRSKFLVPYKEAVGADGLLRYSLHQLRGDEYGTVRGRYSASDKNIEQVINKDTFMESFGDLEYFVRKIIIPGPGMLFGSFDAAQIEFRLFAHYSGALDRAGLGPEKLIAAYQADPNVSFHRIVEAMVKPFKADLVYTKVKSLNFLKVYGGGKSKAADYLELPREESDKFCDIYDQAFPEVKMLSKKAEKAAHLRGYVTSLLGRRARFPDLKFAYKALNAVIQPSAADIFKWKICELHRERKYTGFVLRAPIHDELIGDCPDEESAQRVREVLNRQSFPVPLRVPILWSGGTGKSWAEAK